MRTFNRRKLVLGIGGTGFAIAAAHVGLNSGFGHRINDTPTGKTKGSSDSPSTKPHDTISWQPMDIDSFIGIVRARPLLSYEQLETTTFNRAESDIDEILSKGWSADGINLKTIVPPISWDHSDRSFAYRLHAWEFISPVLFGYSRYKKQSYLLAAVDAGIEWVNLYQSPYSSDSLDAALDNALSQKGTMAWYDMGVGQRCYRLAYLLDCIARIDPIDRTLIDSLLNSLVFHLAMLNRRSFFIEHNNHGLYQALGQLAAARRFEFLPGFQVFRAVANERLEGFLARSFLEDGAHVEHSPAYHRMILGTLKGAVRSGLTDKKMDGVFNAATSAYSWMIQPDGKLANFGDTDLDAIQKKKSALTATATPFNDSEYAAKSIVSDERGLTPKLGVAPFLQSGYAFARIALNEAFVGRTCYFAQIAGFHSRTHKHADHLSFIWHDRGAEILIDPGRYYYSDKQPPGTDLSEQGFWYSDPKRIYIEETRAHNCVEIDGKSYPRKRVKPFGSALVEAKSENGVVITSCQLRHLRTIRHWRGIVLLPGKFLLVLDWLHDGTGSFHDFKQYFQLAPCWQPTKQVRGYSASGIGEATNLTLSVASLIDAPDVHNPVIGQEQPRLLGWRSDTARSLIPTPTLCFEQSARASARFATLFSFTPSIEPDEEWIRVNASMSNTRMGWKSDEGRYRLELTRNTLGSLAVNIR